MTRNNRIAFLLASTLLATSITACADHDHGEGDAAAEACEHLGGSPVAVTATATTTGAPAVMADHKRYEIKLGDLTGGGKGGVVAFESPLKGHLSVFLSADVPLVVKGGNGVEATLNSSSKTGPCTALKAQYEYEVGVGHYDLTFGGTANTTDSVGIVLEAETHAH
jgi:hypothetical protein